MPSKLRTSRHGGRTLSHSTSAPVAALSAASSGDKPALVLMRLVFKVLAFMALFCSSLPTPARAADMEKKIPVLIVDGMNNHDWERGTKLLKAILENSGLFTVDVSTSPTNKNSTSEEWAHW